MTVYESLCRELDTLLIEIVDGCQQKIVSTIETEKHLDPGFVSIAKTRFISGSNSVTSLQLPTEFSNPMEPLVRVTRESQDGQTTLKLLKQSQKQPEEMGLRQRKEVSSETKEQIQQPVTDPIRLFGVLVPQSLRNAQKSFVGVLDDVSTAAQIQSDLNAKLERYSRLLILKKQLVAS